MINAEAILGLISDLYAQIDRLSEENAAIKAMLEKATPPPPEHP